MDHGFAHDREERQALEKAPPANPCDGASASRHLCTPDGYVIHSELSDAFPITDEEIALLRAFLSDEIGAILHGEDQGG